MSAARSKLGNSMKSPTTMWNTKISHSFCTDYTCTSAAETLEVIQGNFVSGKAFWSPYLCDGIMCTKIRVQIWIKPLSEICGFLAVKGEHNRILAHMPCTSARSSAGCQHQSVHHSPPTPFHNTEQKKKSPQHRSEPDQSVVRIKKQTFKESEMAPLIGRTALVLPAQSSNRYLRDKQPSATDIGDV